jgi:CheY-like chemotaxis protein
MALMLAREGYTVETANDGNQALQLLHEIDPGVIFLDVCMPVMDGALFREAQRRDRRLLSIPTIVMTGANVETMLDLAVEETVRKPVHGRDLLGIVSRYVPPPTPPEPRKVPASPWWLGLAVIGASIALYAVVHRIVRSLRRDR